MKLEDKFEIGDYFYEDSSNKERYFIQFRKDNEIFRMGDCALIQTEDVFVNPNREIIENQYSPEDAEAIFSFVDSIKDSPFKILELKSTLDEHGMISILLLIHFSTHIPRRFIFIHKL
jgi:hypothetical protein